MSKPARAHEGAASGLELLGAITDAVESGAGLPEVVRAAARVLDASLALIDRTSAVLAVAARSHLDERSLVRGDEGVTTIELRVAEQPVGRLRMRLRGQAPPALVRLVATMIASEVERVRAPERASEEAATAFLHAVIARRISDARTIVERGEGQGIDLSRGGSVVVARARPRAPTGDDWRARLRLSAERAARSTAPGTIAAASEARADEVLLLVPDADGETGRRVAQVVLRELESGLAGFHVAVGRSRHTASPGDLHRAVNEALLAANVVESDGTRTLLSYDETGTYRILLPVMSEDPDELRRFYAETVEPLVSYDDLYETSDLVGTLEAFFECDGNVGATAQRLFTHRHTIRYRLDRVRELSGLDVSSTEGRERLSLGLKAMRVLGLAKPRGPASEHGAGGGRVLRDAADL